MSQQSDAELLRQSFSVHVSERIVEYRGFSSFLCRRYLRSTMYTENLLQDALESVWRLVRSGKPNVLTESFIRGVLRNTCMNRVRYQRVRQSEQPGEVDVADNRMPIDIELDNRNHIHHGLSVLSPPDRDRLLLFCVAGYAAAELGRREGVSVECVRKRIERSRRLVLRQLRTRLSHCAVSSDATVIGAVLEAEKRSQE